MITTVWGVIFLINAGLGALSLTPWAEQVETLPHTVIANSFVGLGIIFSSLFPKWLPQYALQQTINARDPYKWPTPHFDERPMDGNTHDVIVIGAGAVAASHVIVLQGEKQAR